MGGRTVAFYDIFNGDADGLCALRQLRLHEPRDATLITGCKREIALLDRVQARAGDRLTVLDISLHENRPGLLLALNAGALCLYFDHHFPGNVPMHPGLEAHIRYAPDVCTSLLVDGYLAGRFRPWAVVGAFGDNLPEAATRAAAPLGLDAGQLTMLRQLGECLNYNAYGDSVDDLYFHPAALYRRLSSYVDPLEFARRDSTFEVLRSGFERDLSLALTVTPRLDEPGHLLVILPNEAWSRRVSGTLANRLAQMHPMRAHAVAVTAAFGYTVSVRAPARAPTGADELCRQFASGGGRPAAAGINRLPPEELARFERAFRASFARPA
jgi:hypothetical protein